MARSAEPPVESLSSGLPSALRLRLEESLRVEDRAEGGVERRVKT
jgi:hypothetical protein